jgi:hypothetical protein
MSGTFPIEEDAAMIRIGILLALTTGLLVADGGIASAVAGQPPGAGPRGPGVTRSYKDLVPALAEALTDTDAHVRLSAAALVKIGPEAVTPLTDILKDPKKDKEMRANAVYVLGQMGPEAGDALPALSKALKDNDAQVRQRAAFAIGRVLPEPGEGPVAGPLAGGFPGVMAGGPPASGLAGPAGGFVGGMRGGRRSSSARGSITPPDPGLVLPTEVGGKKRPEPGKETR